MKENDSLFVCSFITDDGSKTDVLDVRTEMFCFFNR